jgi:nitroreductase
MENAPSADGPPQIDVANADLLLSTTRSVRRRLDFDRPVEREVLLECLQLAVQAPTASNRQTWRWMVVTDPDLKRRIADIYREQGMGYTPWCGQVHERPATRTEGGRWHEAVQAASSFAELCPL